MFMSKYTNIRYEKNRRLTFEAGQIVTSLNDRW